MSLTRHEFHSYHVTEEIDHGLLEEGVFRGRRFISTLTACGKTPEEAEAKLKQRRFDLSGYRIEAP